jgi:ResB-like family
MLDGLFRFLSSLKLTVVLLGLAIVLVFVGTLAQVNEGLYQAQTRYFKSFLIFWSPKGSGFSLPVFPGGYLIGTVLLANLLSAHVSRFKWSRKKIGIFATHAGLILLLMGQLLTDALSTESAMRLAEGQALNYSQDFRANELAIIDTSDAKQDRVVVIPDSLVMKQREIRPAEVPFTVRVLQYWENSALFDSPTNGAFTVGATKGYGTSAYLLPMKTTVSMDDRNIPSALVEIVSPEGSLGTWLLSAQTGSPQGFDYKGKPYRLALRFTRYYKPFSLKLESFTHERYRGTDIPKNFASVVRLQRPETGEDREVKIFMNNPLRYNGETYYQAGFDKNNDNLTRKITILQVVRNPGWLTPYFSCALVALGLVIQFGQHLVGFIQKRRAA